MTSAPVSNNLVSIITPLYNGERYLAQTIESVLRQTYTTWEMIIINDGSTDQGEAIARQYALSDDRIHIYSQPNSGSAAARNNGIRHAAGRYIALLDADDIWEANFLESQLQFMAEHNADLVCAAHRRIDENGQDILHPFFPPQQISYQDMLKTNSISCLTGLYDTQKYGKIYLHEEFHSLRDDYIYWLDIVKKVGTVYGNQQILGSYRITNQSVTRNKWKMILPQFRVYYRIEKLGICKSIYYLGCWAVNGLKKYSK